MHAHDSRTPCYGRDGGSNARVGKSDFLVVESDESDGSFLKLMPILAVVTNIDREHLDHYGTFERVLDAFVQFVNQVPFYGAALVCLDDEYVQQMLPRVRPCILSKDNHYLLQPLENLLILLLAQVHI